MLITTGSRVKHPAYGEGIVSKVNLTSYDIFFETKGKVQISKSNNDIDIIKAEEAVENSGSSSIDIAALEEMLIHVLDKYQAIQPDVPLGGKWYGGTLLLQPHDKSLKPKEIPIETFFHKIVMLRDRLRVLEQNINSNTKLDDEDKVNLQQYITRIYGSLTTFNVLFDDKEYYFKGQGGN